MLSIEVVCCRVRPGKRAALMSDGFVSVIVVVATIVNLQFGSRLTISTVDARNW